MTLDLRFLGQLAVIRDGQRVELRSQPARLLLAYLALHCGAPIPRDKIAGALWPDSSTEAARKQLRQTLWRLRRVIGDEHLDVDPRSLRLTPGMTRSDVATLLSNDVADDADALASTVESYGELLPGHYEEWIQDASGPLQATYENRMARLLRALAAQERWDELADWSERWIAHGSGPERAYRALMRAHAGMGDLPGVANAYRRCVIALRRELGVEPSAKTCALHQRLLTGEDPSLDPSSYARGPGAAPLPWPSIRFEGSTPVIEQSVVIDRPHDDVYTLMVDPDLALLYRANVFAYDVISGRPGDEGTQIRATKKLGNEVFDFVVEVLEAERGRWLKSRTVDSPVGLQIETLLQGVTGGTRMTQRRHVELPDSFGGGVDESVLIRWYAADVHSDFQKLKQLLEAR